MCVCVCVCVCVYVCELCVCVHAQLHLSSHSFPFLGSISRLKLKRLDFFPFALLLTPNLGNSWGGHDDDLSPSARLPDRLRTCTHAQTVRETQTLTNRHIHTQLNMHSVSQTNRHKHTFTPQTHIPYKRPCSLSVAKTLWFPLAWAAIHQLGASQPGWQGLTEWHVSFIKRGAPGLRKRTDRRVTKPPESSPPLAVRGVCHGIDTDKSAEIEHTWIHADTPTHMRRKHTEGNTL